MKAIWSYAGLAAALLVAALLIVPGFIDWSRYAGLIENEAEAVTGRDVEIHGAVRISLLPSPRLKIDNITVANIEGGSNASMLEVDKLTAELGLGALLRGRLEISDMELTQPQLLLEQLEDGRANWRFEGALPEADAVAAGSEADGGDAPISIARMHIAGGRIATRNVGVAGETDFDAIDAEVSASSLRGPFRAQGKGVLDGRALGFRLALGEIAGTKAFPANADLSFPGIDLELRGIMTAPDKGSRFDGTVTADVAPSVSPVIAALTGGEKLRMDMALNAGTDQVTVREMLAEGGVLRAQGEGAIIAGTSPRVEGKLQVNRLDVAALSSTGVADTPAEIAAIVGDLMESLPHNAVGDIRLEADALALTGAEGGRSSVSLSLGENNSIDVSEANISLPGASLVTVIGTLAPGEDGPVLSGGLVLDSEQPKLLAQWFGGGAVPDWASAQPLASLDGRASIVLDGKHVSFSKLALRADGGTVQGRADIAFTDRPEVALVLAANGIALPYVALPLEAFSLASGHALDPGFSGQVQLAGHDIAYGGGTLSELRVIADVGVREIVLNEFTARMAGGTSATLTGTIGTASDEAKGSLQATLNAPETEALAALLEVPAQRLEPLTPLSLTAQARWPVTMQTDEDSNPPAGPGGTVTPARLGVAVSLLGRAAAAQVDVGGSVLPGELGLADPDLDLAVEFSSGDWQQLVRIGGAVLGQDLPQAAARSDGDEPAAPGLLTLAVRGAMEKGLAAVGTLSLGSFIADMETEVISKETGLAYSAEVRAGTPRAAVLAQALGIDPRGVASFDAGLRAHFENGRWDLENSQVNLSGEAGEISASVSGSLQMPGQESGGADAPVRPAATGKVAATAFSFDLLEDILFGVHETGAPADAGPDGGFQAAWATGPLDLDIFKAADLSLSFDGAGVSYHRLPVDRLSGLVTLQDGTLTITEGDATLLGGRARLDGVLKTRTGAELSARVDARGIELQRLSEVLGFGEIGAGALDTDLQLEGAGLSQLALVSSLKGGGSLSLREGAFSGFDLNAFVVGISTLEGLDEFQRLADATLDAGRTPVDRLNTDIVVEGGVLRSTGMSVRVEAAEEAAIDAFVDLGRKALDTEAVFSLRDLDKAPPVKIVVSGPFDAPRRNVNRVELEAYAAETLLARDVDALVDGGGSPELRELLGLDPATTP